MGIFANISAALDAHTKLLGLPTAWENKAYNPKQGELYIRPTLLPSGTEPTGLSGSSDDHIGVYQVDVFGGLNKGKGTVLKQVDLVADHFKRGTILVKNGVNVEVVTVSRTSGSRIDARFFMGVEITYRAITAPR